MPSPHDLCAYALHLEGLLRRAAEYIEPLLCDTFDGDALDTLSADIDAALAQVPKPNGADE